MNPPQTKPAKKLTYREKALAGLLPRKERKPVSTKPRKRLRQVAKSNAGRVAEYGRLRLEYLAMRRACEVPECRNCPTEIHHKARRGKFLLRQDTWMAVCRQCHERIEANPAWSMENGFLLTVAQKRGLTSNPLNK